MKDVLYLVHRIPYPPNKGDKIRSFHLLEALASRYRVHLGTFVDTAQDMQHVPALQRYCASTFVAPISPRWRRIASARGLVSGQPLSEAFYWHGGFSAWCASVLREQRIEHIVTFSSSMAQFVRQSVAPRVRRVMDFCDIDSDKWRQYAASRRGLMRWVYGREARLLERLERDIAAEFDASIFVSEIEATIFRDIAPEAASKVSAIRNGVNIDYFDPAIVTERPDVCVGDYVVFTGAMDYWANIEGVVWFVKDVWPLVRAEHPGLRFLIVGSNPVEQVKRLAGHRGVVVTGSVPDIRPYVRHARVAVAPLRIARGIQNKILEAMAMERVVVTTPAAVRGIDGLPPVDVYVADDAEQFAAKTHAALALSTEHRAIVNRQYVAGQFCWSKNLAMFLEVIDPATANVAA